MQQVSRGTVRRRGSQQALLARGIAAPRKTSTRLPVLAEARRLITQSPRAVRLGRIGSHARGKWLVLCALFLGSAVVYGAVIGGQTARAYDTLASALERLGDRRGLRRQEDHRHGTVACDRCRDHGGPRRWT